MDNRYFTFCVSAMFFVLGFYLVFFSINCGSVQYVEDDIEDCADACANLFLMGCEGWDGSPGTDEVWGTGDDLTCVETCEGIIAAGGSLHLDCTIEAQSCAEVDACFE